MKISINVHFSAFSVSLRTLPAKGFPFGAR